MRVVISMFAAALLTGVPAVAIAQSSNDPRFALPRPTAKEMGAVHILRSEMEADQPPEQTLEMFGRALGAAPGPTPFRGMLRCQQGALADTLDRSELAQAAIAECIELLPDHPFARRSYALHLLNRDFEQADGLGEGADALTSLLRDFPHADLMPDEAFVASLVRRLTYAKEFDRVDALIDAFVSTDAAFDSTTLTDSLVLETIYRALNESNVDRARTRVLWLKRPTSVETLLLLTQAAPLHAAAAGHYRQGLVRAQTRMDAMSASNMNVSDGLPSLSRIAVLKDVGAFDTIVGLLERLIAAEEHDYSSAAVMNAGLGALLGGGHADRAFAIGARYAERLTPAERIDNLNFLLTLGYNEIVWGHRDRGLARLAAADAVYRQDTSLTEGEGGRAFMAAIRACDVGKADAETAFAEVSRQREVAPGAWRSALACRGDIEGLAQAIADNMTDPEARDRFGDIWDLRRAEAGLSHDLNPAKLSALEYPVLQAALAKVSRSWAEAFPDKGS